MMSTRLGWLATRSVGCPGWRQFGVPNLDFYDVEPVENARKLLAGSVDSLPGAQVPEGGITAVEPEAQDNCDPDHAGKSQPQDSKEMCCS